MVEIMAKLQQYVPAKEYTKVVVIPGSEDTAEVKKAVFHHLLFGGDQLTVARARGAKRIKSNGITPHSRLEGLVPCAEDWHAKVNFLEVGNNSILHNLLLRKLLLHRLFGNTFILLAQQVNMVLCINYETSFIALML